MIEKVAGIKGKASSLIEEFKAFAFKGNIVDMAIGIIIGAAFGKIVSSFVNSIVMPCVTALFAMPSGSANGEKATDFIKALSFEWNGVAIPYGEFLGELLDFLIVAAVIFFVMKKFLGFMANMRKNTETLAAPVEQPAASKEEVLLTEIRDLLKENAKK
ncbi:MAG: large conductance mechanosensitive channel protein MscL [Fibrobacteraceae bacterium]|nr:large conductance mechanosensitive channel protein MscL [Fibrobacteraceae bacterium]